jgi:hypothetical protein
MNLPVPLNELVGGLVALVAVGGTVALSFTGHVVPMSLVAIDGAAMTYYFSAQAFNAGVDHGLRVAGVR